MHEMMTRSNGNDQIIMSRESSACLWVVDSTQLECARSIKTS